MTGPARNQSLPLLGITIGDPTGIGPEIAVAALQDSRIYEVCRPLVIGRPLVVQRAIELWGVTSQVEKVSEFPSRFEATPSKIYCLECGSPDADHLPPAKIDARGGQAAYDALVEGARLALDGQLSAIVTGPLHKGALHAAGHHWPGHTELLADLCGVKQYAMMLYLPPRLGAQTEFSSSGVTPLPHGGPAGLGVIHVTLHMALRRVFEHLTTAAVLEKIELAHSSLLRIRRALNLPPEPKIAVAALNPHGGEGGLFGNEEQVIIEPAVASARERGWNVTGPLPVDTLMPRAAAGDYDAVVAMYHDQGHIALKLLDMFEAVNITLGLPIIRTSVAHGTAFDLAWQAKADPGGMVQAILTAARMASGGYNQ